VVSAYVACSAGRAIRRSTTSGTIQKPWSVVRHI
jgi:hypothetical protein